MNCFCHYLYHNYVKLHYPSYYFMPEIIYDFAIPRFTSKYPPPCEYPLFFFSILLGGKTQGYYLTFLQFFESAPKSKGTPPNVPRFFKRFQNPRVLPYIFYGFLKMSRKSQGTPLHFYNVLKIFQNRRYKSKGTLLHCMQFFENVPKILGYSLTFYTILRKMSINPSLK